MVQVCLVCTGLQWDSGGWIGWSYKGQFQSLLTYYSPGCLQYTEMTYFKSQQSKLFEFIVKMFRNEIRQGQSQNISLYCHWFYVMVLYSAVQSSKVQWVQWCWRPELDTEVCWPVGRPEVSSCSQWLWTLLVTYVLLSLGDLHGLISH